ncbi:MAG: GNAT family N-acetyltransferase [Patescibacteria group bacterium]
MTDTPEQSDDALKESGMCLHGSLPPCEKCQSMPAVNQAVEKVEVGDGYDITAIEPDDLDGIRAYYSFELQHDFAKDLPGKTREQTIDAQAKYRQSQMRDGKLQVAVVKDGEKIIGTSVVVMESGTMGKIIAEDEAYAAGTLVDPDERGQGIGRQLANVQERLAREKGKTSIITAIEDKNSASMNLRMNIGYKLEGIDKRKDEMDYLYRKDLTEVEIQSDNNWTEEVIGGRLAYSEGEITKDSPAQLLIEPNDHQRVAQALDQGYRGVSLLRPEDFQDQPGVDKNTIVFTRDI